MRVRTEEQLAQTVNECWRALASGEGSVAEIAVRLGQVEAALAIGAVKAQSTAVPWRRAFAGARAPRLGVLYQHHAVPLRVPSGYLHATPPRDPPLVSVVTPSFNQRPFLEQTIRSVLGQRYQHLEYVVQDGRSADGTIEVLEEYGPRLTAWRSEADRGQADGINRAFAHTSGEIMAYLNSDDLLLPGAISHVARFFARHPEVDVVYGHRLLIDAEGRRVGAWIIPPHDDEVLRWADFVPQETLFWRRSAWDRIGARIDDSFAYAMDWDLLLRFLESGAVMRRLPRLLGAFRVHDEQKTTSAHDTGMREVDRLRRRVHGRAVSHDEVMERVVPFLRRHVYCHAMHSALERMPRRQLDVLRYYDAEWVGTSTAH